MSALQSLIVRSFAGGELSPSMGARADIAKYTIGLKRCRNFIVERHGGVSNRPGTRFIGECKTTDHEVRLIRYVSEVPGESVLIEMGELYFRFYSDDALVTLDISGISAYAGGTAYVPGDLVKNGGVIYYCVANTTGNAPPNATYWYAQPSDIYEVPHPFGDPLETNWVQSGRVMTFTHRNHVPQDLAYVSLTNWVLVPLDTKPQVLPPTSLSLSGTGTGNRTFAYKVTAAAPGSYEESEPSAPVAVAGCAQPTEGAPHTVTWTSVLVPPVTGTGCPEYYVYCDPWGNGTFGFVGTATGASSFRNPGLTPDFSITPPIPRVLFAATGEYPETAAYHDQRRYFGNTDDIPDAVYGSRVGFPDNFGIASPLQDDDSITFRIAGNNHHPVHHLVALKHLLVMTGGGEWRLNGNGDVVSPNSLTLDQETYVGIARFIRPVVIGNSVIYVQARQSIIRDLQYNVEVEGLAGRDLTIFAAHLFDGYTVRAVDYAHAPNSIVWVVRSDGTLLGLTYIREQDIWGWHRHDTGADGLFRDVCVVPSSGEDKTYVIVRRTIGGVEKFYIELLESRSIVNFNADSFFVDSGLSYSGSSIATATGLSHLEGETVAIVGDGAYQGTRTVVSGSVALYTAASDVHVGLPIEAEIETLDLDINGTDVRDKRKRVQSATVLVDASSRAFMAGPDSSNLTRVSRASFDPSDRSFTGQVELNLNATFGQYGRVFIRQDQALPLTVLAVIPAVEVSSR